MSLHGYSHRLADKCPSATLLWTATRILCDIHWRWNDEARCFQTHEWTRDSFYKDVRDWPADNALSSLLRALREDDRLAGEPMLRFIGLQIAIEYVDALVLDRRL